MKDKKDEKYFEPTAWWTFQCNNLINDFGAKADGCNDKTWKALAKKLIVDFSKTSTNLAKGAEKLANDDVVYYPQN